MCTRASHASRTVGHSERTPEGQAPTSTRRTHTYKMNPQATADGAARTARRAVPERILCRLCHTRPCCTATCVNQCCHFWCGWRGSVGARIVRSISPATYPGIALYSIAYARLVCHLRMQPRCCHTHTSLRLCTSKLLAVGLCTLAIQKGPRCSRSSCNAIMQKTHRTVASTVCLRAAPTLGSNRGGGSIIWRLPAAQPRAPRAPVRT